MIERIFGQWKSSLVALIIIVTTILLVIFEVTTLTQATPAAIAFLGFFFKDDVFIKKEKSKVIEDYENEDI